MTRRAGTLRLGRGHGDVAGGAARLAAVLAQRLQTGDAAHVALAPRGDAIAQPVLLRDDLAVELVEVAFLLREHLVAPGLEIGKAALDAAGLAAVEPHGDARQVGEKAAVMADQHERRAPRGELALQPFDGGQVEMVGRLVEQQDIGVGRQHPGQRRAPRLAARQRGGVLVAGEAKLLEQIARGVGVAVRARARPRHSR